MSEVKSKETVVVEMVNAEQYTREEILAESGATPGSLAVSIPSDRGFCNDRGYNYIGKQNHIVSIPSDRGFCND